MDIWRQLVDHWFRNGVEAPLPGVALADLDAFERAHDLRLPADLRAYFLATNGTGDTMDLDYFRFWPLREVRPVRRAWAQGPTTRDPYADCLVFADYCIECWLYAVRVGNDPARAGPVFRVTGAASPPDEQLAGSFLEFIEKYLADPSSVMR